jgi:hypothetical protein
MYLSGEIERPEAVSQPLLKNAFAAFQDLGYVVQAAGQLQLPAEAPAEGAVSPEKSIAKYLDREAVS